jgi:hypothetical protein
MSVVPTFGALAGRRGSGRGNHSDDVVVHSPAGRIGKRTEREEIMNRLRTSIRRLTLLGALVLSACGGTNSPTSEGESAALDRSSAALAGACTKDSDCPVPAVACQQCPDGKSFSCPTASCTNGACSVGFTPCPGLIQCGGLGNRPCPAGFACVDDPRDSCSPCRGGSDCGGICVELTCKAACDPELVCAHVVTCVDGLLYPTVCGPRNCDAPIGPCASAVGE